MKRKISKKYNLPKNTLLLICLNIDLKTDIYKLRYNKVKKIFTLPAIFIKYFNSNTIFTRIMVDYNNELYLKKGDNIKISCNYCRIIDDY